jgi:hypothetical protein
MMDYEAIVAQVLAPHMAKAPLPQWGIPPTCKGSATLESRGPLRPAGPFQCVVIR